MLERDLEYGGNRLALPIARQNRVGPKSPLLGSAGGVPYGVPRSGVTSTVLDRRDVLVDLGETTGDDIADLTKAVAAITASLASIKQQSRAREVPAVLAPPGSRVERKLLGQRVVDLEEAQGRLVDAVEAVVELQREFVESHLKNAERYAQSVEVIGKASATCP